MGSPLVFWLVVVPTHLKNISQNGFIFPNFRGENKKYLKSPPSFGVKKALFWFGKRPCFEGYFFRAQKNLEVNWIPGISGVS